MPPVGTLVAGVNVGRDWRYSFTANGETVTVTSRKKRTLYGQAVSTTSAVGARLVDGNGATVANALHTPKR